MTKIKLKSSFVNSNKKDGTPYVNRNGEPFKMCNITSENGNRASMYIGAKDTWKLEIVEKWRGGDEVDVVLTKSGEYTNFDLIRNQTSNHTTQTIRTQPEGISGQIRPIGEEPTTPEPTQEQLVEMFSKEQQSKEEIILSEIPF